MNIDTEKKYIEDIKAGNTALFEHIVRNYQDRIFSFIIRIVRSEEDAKDVTQETFIKVYRNLNRFKGESKFSTWLFQIAYNTAISQQRKQQKQINYENEMKYQEKSSYTGNSQEILEKKERHTMVNEAIKSLPESDAAIVNLYYKEEMSMNEISEILNLSVSNVKVKLHRSRKKLLERLDKLLIL